MSEIMQIKLGVSRKSQLEALSVGESTVVVGTSTRQQVQSAVATAIDAIRKDGNQASFTQSKAMLVMEGQLPIPCSVVTRES